MSILCWVPPSLLFVLVFHVMFEIELLVEIGVARSAGYCYMSAMALVHVVTEKALYMYSINSFINL